MRSICNIPGLGVLWGKQFDVSFLCVCVQKWVNCLFLRPVQNLVRAWITGCCDFNSHQYLFLDDLTLNWSNQIEISREEISHLRHCSVLKSAVNNAVIQQAYYCILCWVTSCWAAQIKYHHQCVCLFGFPPPPCVFVCLWSMQTTFRYMYCILHHKTSFSKWLSG